MGMLALKLLLECQCEVTSLEILVIGSDPFGQACVDVLKAVGAHVTLLDPQNKWPNDDSESAFERADAVVVVEHRHRGEILGSLTMPLVDLLACRDIPLVHICGAVDADYLSSRGIQKYPAQIMPHGFMTVTTSYVGFKPLVDLHTAGLHVASIVARERRNGATIDAAISTAVASGYGLDLIHSTKLVD